MMGWWLLLWLRLWLWTMRLWFWQLRRGRDGGDGTIELTDESCRSGSAAAAVNAVKEKLASELMKLGKALSPSKESKEFKGSRESSKERSKESSDVQESTARPNQVIPFDAQLPLTWFHLFGTSVGIPESWLELIWLAWMPRDPRDFRILLQDDPGRPLLSTSSRHFARPVASYGSRVPADLISGIHPAIGIRPRSRFRPFDPVISSYI